MFTHAAADKKARTSVPLQVLRRRPEPAKAGRGKSPKASRVVTLMPNKPILEVASLQTSTQKLKPALALAADKEAGPAGSGRAFGSVS